MSEDKKVSLSKSDLVHIWELARHEFDQLDLKTTKSLKENKYERIFCYVLAVSTFLRKEEHIDFFIEYEKKRKKEIKR